MAYELSDELVSKLKRLAETLVDNDHPDFSPFDYQDGPDDAWDGGNTNGEVELAREILEAIGVEFTVPEPDEDD